jgi:hypothetical protein
MPDAALLSAGWRDLSETREAVLRLAEHSSRDTLPGHGSLSEPPGQAHPWAANTVPRPPVSTIASLISATRPARD